MTCINQAEAAGWQRRHSVVLLCFFSTLICYLDRVNISVAIIPMAKQFGWTDSERGLVLSSFFLGYMATQVMGGSLSACFGGKAVLGFGVLWWSLFTILTPLSALTSFPVLIASRSLMGLGEGVAFPATYNLLGRWVPAQERSRAAAFNLSAIPLGTMLAITLTPIVALTLGWPWVFYLFGGLGFIWFLFWWRIAGDRPDSPACESIGGGDGGGSATDADSSSAAIPYRQILTKGPVWAIIFAHFCNNWGLYVLLSWLPSYFSSQLQIDLRSVWVYVAPPWIAMFIFSNVAGWSADHLIRLGYSTTVVRKVMQSIGSVVPAIALVLLASTEDAVTAVVLLTVTLSFGAFSGSGFACNHLDISPRHAGAIWGISNTAATIPGIVGVALTGFIVDATGSFASAFYVAAGIYVFGMLTFLLFATGRQIIHD